MKSILTNYQAIECSSSAAFNFFSDFRNFGELLPKDRIENYVCEKDFCSFTIQGIARLEVKICETTLNEKIVYESKNISSFPLQLVLNIKDDSGKPFAHLNLYSEANAFVWMMAEKQLTALLNLMNEKLVSVCKDLK